MKSLLFLVIAFAPTIGHATCTSDATDKKLYGAARTSFMNRCHTDAVGRCEQAATDKKLSGAARTSFTDKCVKDGVGQ